MIISLLKIEKPGIVLIHGDATTTIAGSSAPFYYQVKIGNLEVGLQMWNKYVPFTKELTLRLTDKLSGLYSILLKISLNINRIHLIAP